LLVYDDKGLLQVLKKDLSKMRFLSALGGLELSSKDEHIYKCIYLQWNALRLGPTFYHLLLPISTIWTNGKLKC